MRLTSHSLSISSNWKNNPLPLCLRASSALDLLQQFASQASLRMFLVASTIAIPPLYSLHSTNIPRAV